MFGIGPLELVMILVVALLVFGPKRVPELARTLGRGLAEFRRASSDLRQSLALDELQQDLRRDLSPNQTIHRPDPKPDTAPDTAADSTPDTTEAAPESSETTATPTPHPGELPLGNDNEHHDEATGTGGTPKPQPSSMADPDLGNVPAASADPTDPKRG
jgi:TatA/E family protein of Tat protein translocase